MTRSVTRAKPIAVWGIGVTTVAGTLRVLYIGQDTCRPHSGAFTDDTAHHYSLLCGRLRAQGRSPRGRAMDVMIAATALTLGVPLVTRNTNDVDRLDVELLQR
jgi:hypothetical protein